jgi:hypothetical protein
MGNKIMIRSEIEAKYGKELTERLFKSRYMQGVTCIARRLSDGKPAMNEDFKNGNAELDFYEDDVERAFREMAGKFVHPLEWD